MEFNEKLQELRKKKGLTQEELAKELYVSRTAVSKWESGRGYPNIDSLKAIAKFYSVTVDELLSGDEILDIAEKDSKEKESKLRDIVFGLLDISVLLLLFLPFFGQRSGEAVQEVSLLSLTEIPLYLQITYFAVVIGMAVWGFLALVLKSICPDFMGENKNRLSLILNATGVVTFIIGQQPYGAVMLFVFLAIKGLMLIKWR